MILIGENIHIISKVVSEAVRNRDTAAIQALAKAQAEAGADYLDLNMGPARKDPEELGAWLVQTVQEVTDIAISLDTMNPVAMEAGLKLCRKRPLLNSASGKADSKTGMMPLAPKYNTQIIISVITDRGCPPDVDSRVESIMDTVAYANGLGIKNEDIWVDPIILPVSADQKQVREALEFMKILPDLLPGVKSVVGLSNVSNGTPAPLRGILNRTYMLMLERNGLYSAIADVLDPELVELNKGGMPEVRELIGHIMEGETVNAGDLDEKGRSYVKTARVLLGETLYSHAWLES
ncbi:MAG: dihydropteroate synthase [Dehalococcoidia bacterium]|nr:dihydropteroate synthase [Dehalococcoidia bacterium]MDD5494514.1 dihydropteroate synthase [Dehalococcoidia bacterium]